MSERCAVCGEDASKDGHREETVTETALGAKFQVQVCPRLTSDTWRYVQGGALVVGPDSFVPRGATIPETDAEEER